MDCDSEVMVLQSGSLWHIEFTQEAELSASCPQFDLLFLVQCVYGGFSGADAC